MRKIIIFTEAFPYEKVEPFLESEIKYYSESAEVIIVPCFVKDLSKPRVIESKNIKILNIKNKVANPFIRKTLKLFNMIMNLNKIDILKELLMLFKQKKLNRDTIKHLLVFSSNTYSVLRKVKKLLPQFEIGKDDDIVFYSYWMYTHAYLAVSMKKEYPNSKAVSRCHGYDLYEYRNKYDYLPLRKEIINNLDLIFSISKDGKYYLREKYPDIRKNIQLSRLGTLDKGYYSNENTRKVIKIVSCSWVVPVKRLNRIITSLEKICDIEIEWTHIGDGPHFHSIKKLSEEKLGHKENIIYQLEGSLSNGEILKKYMNKQYDVFINVSESEGIPVSIMEAMSFGIPTIACDVGGVSEIVIDEQNGYLLDQDFKDEELVDQIKKIASLDDNEYSLLRNNARDFWEKSYRAESNYKNFFNTIINL